MLLPLLIYSTQFGVELLMSYCSFKLNLQRSLTGAILVLTVAVILMDFSRLGIEVFAGQGYSKLDLSTSASDIIFGSAVLLVGLISLLSA